MRLLHGDCLDVLRTLPDGSVDAVIADPPYGTTACKWDAVIPFAPMWEQLRRVAKPGAAIIFTAQQPFTSALIMSNPRWFRQTLVWDKMQSTDPQLANVRPMRRHEDIVVFCQRGPTYNPQMVEREKPLDMRNWKPSKDGDLMRIRKGTNTRRTLSTHRYPNSILAFSSVEGDCNSARRVHPTQKPVDLIAYLVRTYTNPGDTVLDFCMGSGTTGVACLQEGRDFIGIEREAAYFAIAERRIAAAQPPLFAEVACAD
jgi:site-specific DNA-methyltransferase (adenine-specific)